MSANLKKVVSFIISTAVMLCAITLNSFAASRLSFGIVPVSDTAPGEELRIEVKIKDNPGFWGGQLRLEFDNTKLTPTSIEKGSSYSEFSLTSNADAGAETDFSKVSYVTAVLSKDNAANATAADTLFTVTFDVSENASGNTTLALSSFKFYDADFTSVTCEPVNVTVHINGSEPAETEAPATAKPSAEPTEDPSEGDEPEDNLVFRIAAASSVDQSGELSVNVNIRHNPGFWGGQLRLEFDNTKLTPTSIEKGSSYSEFSLTSNADPGAKTDFSKVGYVTAVLSKDSATNVTASGTLFTVKFDVSEYAYGDTPLSLTGFKFYDADYASVLCEAVNAAVHINGDPKVTDEPVTDFSVKYVDGAAQIASPSKSSCRLIAAVYSEGRLVKVSVKAVDFESSGTKTEELADLSLTSGDKLKLFLWGSINTAYPLCHAYSYDI